MKFLGKVLLLILCLSTVCEAQEKNQTPVYRNIYDLYGKKVGTATGSNQEAVLQREHPNVDVMRFDTDIDMLQALRSKRCEAIVMDEHIFYYYSNRSNEMVPIGLLYSAECGFCFQKGHNVEMREQLNAFLKQIKLDGTYDEIIDRWIKNTHDAVMPEIQLPAEGDPIRVATSTACPPMAFYKNGELVGFDIEIILRFAASIGRPVVFSDMNFSGLIPSLVSGKQDIVCSGVNITEQRKRSIDYSDAYYICPAIIIIRTENSEGYLAESAVKEKTKFIETVKNSFRRNIIEEDRYLMLLDGLKTTSVISLLSCLLGTILGAMICWMRMNRNLILRHSASFYISLMRGTPILVLLMIMFYVVFAGTSVDAVTVSVITFGLNFAAYVSEMFRSSIENIDKGQTEAGIAMGFTPAKTFYYIVMPQAVKQVLPIYKGELISLVKMTSIVGFIAVQDLTKVGDIIRSRTFDAFFPLIMVAILYFILSWIFVKILDLIGKKIG